MALCINLFGIANYFFSASNVIYDKILVQIASPSLFSKISGYGYAWGYFGGGFLFLINACMSLYPELFGLSSELKLLGGHLLQYQFGGLYF